MVPQRVSLLLAAGLREREQGAGDPREYVAGACGGEPGGFPVLAEDRSLGRGHHGDRTLQQHHHAVALRELAGPHGGVGLHGAARDPEQGGELTGVGRGEHGGRVHAQLESRAQFRERPGVHHHGDPAGERLVQSGAHPLLLRHPAAHHGRLDAALRDHGLRVDGGEAGRGAEVADHARAGGQGPVHGEGGGSRVAFRTRPDAHHPARVLVVAAAWPRVEVGHVRSTKPLNAVLRLRERQAEFHNLQITRVLGGRWEQQAWLRGAHGHGDVRTQEGTAHGAVVAHAGGDVDRDHHGLVRGGILLLAERLHDPGERLAQRTGEPDPGQAVQPDARTSGELQEPVRIGGAVRGDDLGGAHPGRAGGGEALLVDGRGAEGRIDGEPAARQVGRSVERVPTVVPPAHEREGHRSGDGGAVVGEDGERAGGEGTGGLAHERDPGGQERGLRLADGGGIVGADHGLPPADSAMTYATARPPSWERERCQRSTPWRAASAATVPVIAKTGRPCGPVVTSQSCQRMPPGEPRAFATASLAANRAASE